MHEKKITNPRTAIIPCYEGLLLGHQAAFHPWQIIKEMFTVGHALLILFHLLKRLFSWLAFAMRGRHFRMLVSLFFSSFRNYQRTLFIFWIDFTSHHSKRSLSFFMAAHGWNQCQTLGVGPCAFVICPSVCSSFLLEK